MRREAVPGEWPLAIFILLLLALAIAGVFLASCHGSPTEPQGVVLTMQTHWGPVTVVTNGYSFNEFEAQMALVRGYDRARAQIGPAADAIRLDGLRVSVQGPAWSDSLRAVGVYVADDDEIGMLEGVERVLDHEVQHRFAYKLGKRGECFRLQDHSPGYDLHCGRMP